jgi:hypothetical protein
MNLRNLLPITDWLARYERAWLSADLIAGITLAAYAIPVSLAYASLAGLPPEMGLYCYLAGGLGYLIFGSSRHLAIGPDVGHFVVARRVAVGTRSERSTTTGSVGFTHRSRDGWRIRRGLAVSAERARQLHFGKHSDGLQGRRCARHRCHAVAEVIRRERRWQRFLRTDLVDCSTSR